MSGLAAVFERSGGAPSSSILDHLASSLRPIGPEWSRTLVSGPAGFAYAHSSNTPEALGDSQPLSHAPSDTVFLFDGRLDNRAELIERLGLDPASAAPLPDSMLARTSWQLWQEKALDLWIGDFAVIHWDGKNRQITAAVDPFGRRGLSYHLTPRRLVIASMPKTVCAHPDIPLRLDQRKVAEAAGRMFVVQDETLFEGIARLPGGTVLTVSSGNDRSQRYYDIAEKVAPVRYRRDEDYVARASELLACSVQARLRSVGPVASQLSGGLDSSLMAIEAADQLSRSGARLETFTAVPEEGWDGRTEPHAYGDERPYVADIARLRPDMGYNFIDCAGKSLSFGAKEFFAASDYMIPGYVNLHWLHTIGQAARHRGITVMLEGGFGNMTFSNKGEDVTIEMLRSGRVFALLTEISRQHGSIQSNVRTFLRQGVNSAILARLPSGFHKVVRRARRLKSADLLQSPIRSEMLDRFGSVERLEHAIGKTLGAPYASMKDVWMMLLNHHSTAIAGEANRGFFALHGIEFRDPFADRRIVEWCFGLPADQFARHDQTRWLARRMMAGRLPDTVIYKPKNLGRQAADWHLKFAREIDEFKAALSRARTHPLLEELFDFSRLDKIANDWPSETPVGTQASDYRMLVAVHQAIMFVETFDAQQSDQTV